MQNSKLFNKNKILFLTSSPTGSLDGKIKVNGLDDRNQFVQNLRSVWKENARVLMIAAYPDHYDGNDRMTEFFRGVFEMRGFSISRMDILDNRWENLKEDALTEYDFLILAGGHVPTENAYFEKIDLRKKMEAYSGIVMGISAGTMNSADVVYAQPEEPGESSPEYQRFYRGLNLTQQMILPHYQMVKDYYVDDKKLYKDLTYADSYGHCFLVLPDGSYLFSQDGEEKVYGEAWMIQDGEMRKINELDGVLTLS